MGKDTIDVLKELIKIPSFVDNNTNENKLGQYVYDFLKKNTDLTVEKQLVENDRFNVIAYAGKSPQIIIFGHLDTVPPKVETESPFNPRVINNNLYGLGAVDMKSGLAITLSIAKKYKDKKDIGFIFTVDEEYEFKGTKELVKKYNFSDCKIILNIEPTSLMILNGCRGVTEFSFEVIGKSCHAGRKQEGVNAIEKTVKIFDLLQKEISKLDNDGGNNSLNLAHLNGGVLDQNNNVICSGNVVPNYAFCVGEIRLSNKKITEVWIKSKIEALGKILGTECKNFDFKFLMKPAFSPKAELKIFESAIKDCGLTPRYENINTAGYFEVQILQEFWNSNIVIFGPGPASQAHRANEYVEIDTIYKTQEIIESYLQKKGV